MPLAAAVIGSAVVGAGAAVYSSSQAKSAANDANAENQQAAANALAAQQANFDRIYNVNQPFVQGGVGAYNQLLDQYHIAPPGQAAPTPANTGTGAPTAAQGPGGTAAPTAGGGPHADGHPPTGPAYPGAPYTTPGSGGGFDAKTYLQQNPDVLANFQQMEATPEGKAYFDGQNVTTPDQAAALHYQQFGQNEGRAEPMNPSVLPQTVTPDLMNGQRPAMAPAPTYTRPDATPLPNYGSAPDLNSFFSNFQEDPGYQYARQQGLDSVNANSAARGLLRSGAAVKALQTQGDNLANQHYNDWFNRQNTLYNDARNAFQSDRTSGLNVWNTQQNRSDTNFNNDRAYGTAQWQYGNEQAQNNFNFDRGYQTSRYDTNTGNLFNLADEGLRAAGNVSGAGTNLANAQTSIYGSQANSAANAATQRASANAQLGGSLAGTASNLFANWGGMSSNPGMGGQTVGQAWNSYNGGGFQTPSYANPAAMPQPVF
jgi:hypothetical protein